MKNIGFYGHSSCAYRSKDSFLDIVADRLNLNIVNTGTRQGSEERILYELKKTKNLDVAVIFHSDPTYLFLPGADRDVGINNMSAARAEYMWDQFAEMHHKKFIEKFKTANNFWSCFETFKNYFYDPDLQMNRYYGALSQIDMYLTSKKIPCIHVVDKLPSWFKFTSGTTDYSIINIIKNNPQSNSSFFANCVTKEGNNLIAETLISIIDNFAARDREVKCA